MGTMPLSAGTIDYTDTGGNGPVLVLLSGVVMSGSVWDPVVSLLRDDYRCVVATLPLGAHRRPMNPDADLTLPGFGRMVAELLEGLDLHDVTLVQNDHVAALVLAGNSPGRVARLVISSCEAFENYPPGLPGKFIRATAMIPGGIFLAAQGMRLRMVRRLPLGYGWMAKHALPDPLLDDWLRPLQTERGVRRDLSRYLRRARRRHMLDVCEALRSFDRPTLVVWTPEDRVQRPDHGRRFVELLPDARLVEIPDSYTLIMRDQPAAFARTIAEFMRSTQDARAPR